MMPQLYDQDIIESIGKTVYTQVTSMPLFVLSCPVSLISA